MSKKNKILIVDDEQAMTEELKEILQNQGYDVLVASDGIQALENFRNHQFKLVLLDIKMPKMDGVETYRRMRKINSEVPIIIVTGSFAKKHAEQVLKEGAQGVVYKPFDVEKFLNKIKIY